MIVIWLLGGIAAVSIAFFIPPNSTELWPSLNAAAIPLVLYVLALAFYTLRSPITLKARVIAWVSILLVGGATVVSWTGMDNQSHWQRNQLLKIHNVITRGILHAFGPREELKTLDAYYHQRTKKQASLGQVFLQLHPGATVGSNVYRATSAQDSTMILIQSLSDDKVVLVGLHAYARGRDPGFVNFGGRKGMVQERFTLTEKGIAYESEN